MKTVYCVLDKFCDDKIIISNDKVYNICKTYQELIDLLDDPSVSSIYTYLFYTEDYIDLYLLFSDGSTEQYESSNSILYYLEKNNKIKESLIGKSLKSNDRNNLEYVCKMNAILNHSFDISNEIKNKLPEIKPSNEYELLKLIVSKNPEIGNIIILEDKKDGHFIKDINKLELIRNRLIRTPITSDDSDYIYHTSRGYTINKEHKTFEIKNKSYGNDEYIF